MIHFKNSELMVFKDIIKTGSFSKTAENLCMAQANVSKLINSLEEKVGMNVFDRNSRPVKLTTFGADLYPYFESYLSCLSQISAFTDAYKNIPKGTVSVFAPEDIQILIVENVVPLLEKSHPDIQLSFTTYNSTQAEDEIINEYDILISSVLPRMQTIVARKLKKLKLNVYCNDEFYENNKFNHPKELSSLPFILAENLMSSPFSHRLEIIDNLTNEIIHVVVTGKLKFDNGYAAYECCKNGHGYFSCSTSFIRNSYEVKPRLDERFSMYIQPYVIYKRREQLPYRVKIVLDLIFENISSQITPMRCYTHDNIKENHRLQLNGDNMSSRYEYKDKTS